MSAIQQASTKQDILQYLLKEGQGTAQELATVLAISPQAIRRHLNDLEDEGLIEHHSVQLGMGRPQHIYQLSRKGRDRFPHGYGEFTVSFLDTLVETVGAEQVGEVLRKQWERKATEYREKVGSGSLEERLTNLAQLRQEEGYMTELHPYQSESGAQGFIFAEHHCTIAEVAESFPSVCGHELEMFGGILPDCVIERTHWLNDGEHRCGYSIIPKGKQ